MRSDPGFGPRDEKEATNGAGTINSWDLWIIADGNLCLSEIVSVGTRIGNRTKNRNVNYSVECI